MEGPYSGCQVSFAYNRAFKDWLDRALRKIEEDLPGVEVSSKEMAAVSTIMITGAFVVDTAVQGDPISAGNNGQAGRGFRVHSLILAADRALRMTSPSRTPDKQGE